MSRLTIARLLTWLGLIALSASFFAVVIAALTNDLMTSLRAIAFAIIALASLYAGVHAERIERNMR